MPRIVAALLVLLLAGSTLVLSGRSSDVSDQPFAIRAQPVALDVADPSRDQVGALKYLGGWALSSSNPDFGGISGMALDGESGFITIGDAGGVFRFALDERGRVSRAEILTVPAGPEPADGGEPQKRDRDAESLAYDPASGHFWVGFERANAIWRYDSQFEASDAHHAPEGMVDWPANSGAEAIVRLRDGRFLIFSENGDGPRNSREAFLFASDPSEETAEPIRFGYRPPTGYRITDAAMLPDRRLILLNRRFSFSQGVSVIVTIAEFDAITEGAIIEGRAIAQFDPPLTIDNMEALAVVEDTGRTIIWMASDDNFNPLQRTLLLKFELVEEN